MDRHPITIHNFEGDFYVLPLASAITLGRLPMQPTSEDFHLAVSVLFHNRDSVIAMWRVEAIRELLAQPAKTEGGVRTLGGEAMRRINRATAKRVYEAIQCARVAECEQAA